MQSRISNGDSDLQYQQGRMALLLDGVTLPAGDLRKSIHAPPRPNVISVVDFTEPAPAP